MIDALKLALIPASILAATLVARRFGHGVAGVLSGLPMIAGPIVAVLLIDRDAASVAAIAEATLAGAPATPAFVLAYAWAARRFSWWSCLAIATLVFFAIGIPTTRFPSPAPWLQLAALAAPLAALAAMPRVPPSAGGVPVPQVELAVRIVAALLLGGLVTWSAGHATPRIGGLLLAWPITGSILPSFTLPLYGRDATATLLRGFANGLVGFALFFAVLGLLLRADIGRALSFAIALAAAAALAWGIHRVRARLAAAGSAPAGATR